MLKIGEFSHLCQVSVKTLRYYDEIGLLRPAEVDRFTNHRYYALSQLPRIHRILALKELGLSLDQIRKMLNDELAESELRGMLRLQEAEVQQELREAQQRLERVRFHLKMIETEHIMSELNVVMKSVDPMHVMIMDWHEGITPILKDEIANAVQAGQLQHTGKYIQVFDGDVVNDDWSNARYAWEVEPSQPDNEIELPTMGALKRGTLQGNQHVATIMLENAGNNDSPRDIQASLNRWAVENGYRLQGESRTVYHRGPMHNAERGTWILELQTFVEPAE